MNPRVSLVLSIHLLVVKSDSGTSVRYTEPELYLPCPPGDLSDRGLEQLTGLEGGNVVEPAEDDFISQAINRTQKLEK